MKKTMTALCVAAAASWVMTAGAQTQTTTEKAQKENKSGKAMTFTGCVQEGVTPNSYTLTNVTSTGAAGSGAGMSGTTGSTSGTSGSATGSGSMSGMNMENMTYQLVPSRGVDLKSHVGHQVQITGMMDKGDKDQSSAGTGAGMGSGTTGTGTAGTGSGTTGSGTTGSGSSTGSMSGQSSSSHGSMSGMEHKLRVQSVKMLSSTCPGGEGR